MPYREARNIKQPRQKFVVITYIYIYIYIYIHTCVYPCVYTCVYPAVTTIMPLWQLGL